MWEPRWKATAWRWMRSISNSVNDAEDLLELDKMCHAIQVARGERAKALVESGYSIRELARATGHDKTTVQGWINLAERAGCTHKEQTEESSATYETPVTD